MDEKPQHKTRFTELDRRESEEYSLVSTGEDFLNKLPLAQALRSTIDKWDLMKLNISLRQRTISFRQSSSLQNEKCFYQIHIQ